MATNQRNLVGRACFFLCVLLALAGSGHSSAGEGEATAPPVKPFGAAAASSKWPDTPRMDWQTLEPGLELGIAAFAEYAAIENAPVFVILRIDPSLHGFALSMASQAGRAYPPAGWSDRDSLRAGINASMYLPDNMTSTGYMRSGEYVNNKTVGERLGAFFVAGNRKPGLPPADIIERDAARWRERLDEYDIVIQNFRFLSGKGELLWRGEGRMHSIAVVGKDRAGRILFMLCQRPMTPAGFSRYLEGFSLQLDTVMYVEGGAQAGLFVRLEAPEHTGALPRDTEKNAPVAALPGASSHASAEGTGSIHVWKGRQSLLNTRGNSDAMLPNIIGVKRN